MVTLLIPPPGWVDPHNWSLALGIPTLSPLSFGADPTGTLPSDFAFANAYSELGGQSGTLHVQAGNYLITSGMTFALPDTQTFGIVCDPGVLFTYTGSGDCIRMFNTPGSVGRARGSGIWGNPVIDGFGSTGTSAVHFGDIFQGKLFFTAQGFTQAGAKCLWLDNHIAFTEQLEARIVSNRCANALVFDVTDNGVLLTSTASYARPKIDVLVQTTSATASNFNGVVFQNGAAPYDGQLSIRGNFPSTSGTAGAVVVVTGTIPAGHPNAGSFSKFYSSQFDIGVESTTAGPNFPQTINFGAAGNLIRDTYGVLAFEDFGGAGIFAASNLNSVGALFRHNGNIIGQTTGLVATDYMLTHALGAIANNATIPVIEGANVSVNPAGAVTGIIIANGTNDGMRLTIKNLSANSVTFAAAGTSNVAAGVTATVPALTSRLFVWDAAAGLWFGGV